MFTITIVRKFWTAATVAAGDPATTSLSPTGSRLAWAAAQVLDAHGANITVLSSHTQVPLGASSDPAAHAEQWQFTTGQCPGLSAIPSQGPIVATLATLTDQWPWFASALLEHTPYRSVYCLPLRTVGTLDLYFTDPTGCQVVDTRAAQVIAEQATYALHQQVTPHDLPGPGAQCTAAQRRANVWTATGMLQEAMHVSSTDALDLLRARAYAHSRPIDDIATDLITGALSACRW